VPCLAQARAAACHARSWWHTRARKTLLLARVARGAKVALESERPPAAALLRSSGATRGTEAAMVVRSAAERVLMVAMVAVVTMLLLARTPSRVESSEGTMLSAPEVNPGAGWQQSFHDLAVGP
jgi:hypothetical protein